ncbi:MAG: FecR family protein [Lentisphaeraceae bacterium]|nr:FecR family protein [Lentisphaeraceae bacterium]
MNHHEKLILRYLDDSINDEERQELNKLLKTDKDARELLLSLSEQTVIVADVERTRSLTKPTVETIKPIQEKHSWIMPAVAALIAIALTINFLYVNSKEATTLQANSISGEIHFKNDRGEIVSDIANGDLLTNGYISSTSEDASIEIIFKDQSKVSFFGRFTAKISENKQKIIILEHGYLSASISPQAKNLPFTIQTSTAKIEVIGTKFEVDASKKNTKLTVNEGSVQFTRLVDGKVLKVTSEQTAETKGPKKDFTLLYRDSQPIHNWQSDFTNVPKDWLSGELLEATDNQPARLKAMEKTFFNQELGKELTIYRVSQRTQWHTATPVTLKKNSRIRVKGKVDNHTKVFILLLTKYPTGGYAGNFMWQAQPRMDDEGNFEILATTEEFERLKPWPARNVAELQIYSMTVYTVDVDENLEVSKMEIMTPED